MAYKITSQCISCDRCIPQCPTNAIKIVEGRHWIDPSICTNCVGTAYGTPQCVAGCPTYNGCVPVKDYWETWFSTYNRLVGKLTEPDRTDYWEGWFHTYSHKFSEMLAHRQHQTVGVEA